MRIYDFEFPYDTTKFFRPGDLKAAGLWDLLSPELQTKMQTDGAEFAADDLPDPVWAFVAEQLGLAWRDA
jgi:hypothetical protein